MNTRLRSVGCYSSTSKRQASTAPGPGNFTVKEYRIYRAVVDAPGPVSEQKAFENAAKRYRVTLSEARAATKKVQEELARNEWFGTPDSEIRHASDWKGENR